MITLDFELEIGPSVAGSYPVVARTPAGETSTNVRMPVSTTELGHQLGVVRDSVLASSAVVRRGPTEHEQPVRELGRRLFETLIADEVRALYVASRQRARENGGVLRLVLRVRPPELARLPWEFLFDPAQQDYVALNLPVVRYLQVLAPRQPLQVEPPLRILGMVARPDDQHALDAGLEVRRLQAALADLAREGLVELGWVARATYRELEEALEAGPWQVFHFVGHGGYDRVAEEGTLALADETGRTHPVGADDISRLLAEHHPLRLVVLNACDTGRGSASDPFSSTAAALIRREIPAVVAMQFEITDSAAVRFAQTFYEYVARLRAVDDSVMRARRALRLGMRDTLEWGTPVLYLRAPDGRIFDSLPPSSPGHRSLPDPPPESLRVFSSPNAVQVLQHRERANGVAFNPHGDLVATASGDGTARVWDAACGQERLRVTHNGGVWAVVFSPDGHWLATAGGDRTARLWDAARGRERVRVSHNDSVWGVVFSPDGRRLATASRDNTARVWDATTGQPLATVAHNGEVPGVAFSPDGRRLATAGGDGTARIWDATSGRQIATVVHNGEVWAVVFSPDGRRFATASHDHTARVWDATTGREQVTVTHSSWVQGVAFSPDGRRLATASADRTARVWDATTGQELATVTHDGVVLGVAFSPDGRRLATAGVDGTARVWVLSDDE